MPALDYHYRTLYFLKYNNYANRIMKREDTLEDYLDASYNHTYIQVITDCKLWNPNDGINTVITTPLHTDFSIEPDYLLVCDDDSGVSTISSKWFITETVRLMSGQYECHLKRDVFAEAWDELMDATCHIDRAILDSYNPLTYNPEPISVNQIIYTETFLKDKTQCPWIVFYGQDKPGQVVVDTEATSYDLETDDRAAWIAAHKFRYFPNDVGSTQLSFMWRYYNGGSGDNDGYHLDLIPGGDTGYSTIDDSKRYRINPTTYTPALTNTSGIDSAAFYGAVRTYTGYKSASDYAQLESLNGKYLYDSSNGKFYRISIGPGTDATINIGVANNSVFASTGLSIINEHSNIPDNQTGYTEPTYTNFGLHYVYREATVSLYQETSPTGIVANVPTLGVHPDDSPYNMWCMPYSDTLSIRYKNGSDDITITSNSRFNLEVAMAFSRANSSNKIYDFQILPYCPLPGSVIQDDGSIYVTDPTLTDKRTMVNALNQTVGFIFACPHCSFTTQIAYENSEAWIWGSRKLASICQVSRLYSPNYSSSFEFSTAKNNGLYGFNIRCTYMPINPYIRVAPIWGGLYGISGFTDDPRGLICKGDFSLARIADSWVSYQEQNKNFEAVFNRQINHMDVMRKYEKVEQVSNALSGTVQGGVYGALVGGGAGAAAGAAISAAAGVADMYIGGRRYEENRSYATDLHKLELANVQAMPETLARTTAFNIDNRYFPVFTIYYPTPEEVNYVVNYINNHSMSVGIVDFPRNYVNNRWESSYGAELADRGFISGSIIKIDTIHDTHFVDALNDEFTKGVYLR